MLNQPSHFASSAPVHSDASRAHSRLTFPLAAHSSRVALVASFNSRGREKLCGLIPAAITKRASLGRGCRSASHETLEAFNVRGTSDATVGDNRGDQFVRGDVERKVVHGDAVRCELLITNVGYFPGIAFFDGDLLAAPISTIDLSLASAEQKIDG